ncbi:MAG: hypothetical protein MI746_13290 [Pseudomonadales bacterium]|nr:hypothetical protein [Pseudomonadales bacterium]
MKSITKIAPLAIVLSLLTAGVSAQTSDDLAAQARQLESQVAEIAEGTYDQASIELLRSLATTYARLQQVEEAYVAYTDALQAIRIAEGLASESQLQLLDEFNVLLFEQQDWETLDAHFHLSTDIAARLYGPADPRYQDAARTLASWKIRAFQTGLYEGRGDRSIQQAAEIYRGFAEHLDADAPDYEQKLATYLSARGLAYFYSASHVASLPLEEFRAAPQYNNVQSCIPTILSIDGSAQPSAAACQVNQSSDPEYFASQQREKSQAVRGHLGNMRQSFQEAIEAVDANPNASLRDRAIAILNYGDANMLAEDYQRARSQYARAYELLSFNEESIKLRDELMDQPTKAFQGVIGELRFDNRLQGNVALGTISFDVSDRGEIQNIDIQGSEEALSQENIGAIAMMLGQAAYRPRIVDGRPVASRITLSAADL